eukprot:s459_g11.t2
MIERNRKYLERRTKEAHTDSGVPQVAATEAMQMPQQRPGLSGLKPKGVRGTLSRHCWIGRHGVELMDPKGLNLTIIV